MASKLCILALTLAVIYISQGKVVDVAPTKCATQMKHKSVIGRTTVKNKAECSALCDKLDTCKSFQVQSSTKRLCTKLKRTIGTAALNLMPKRGWTYKESVRNMTNVPSKSCSKQAPQCNPAIESISDTEIIFEGRGDGWGWWGRDHGKTEADDPRYFWVSGWHNNPTIYWWESLAATWQDRVRYQLTNLPYGCDGLGYLIYNGKFFCNQYNTRIIQVYDLAKGVVVASISFDSVDGNVAGQNDQCSYDWGGWSDFDVKTDGTGVYVVWGKQNSNCGLSISKINLDTYSIERTWYISYYRRWSGATFMVCGRLYSLECNGCNPTYIDLVYDLRTNNQTEWYNNYNRDTPWISNEFGQLGFINYNPMDGYLYVHNAGRAGRKKIQFVNRPYEEVMWRNI